MKQPVEIRTVAILGCGLVGFSWATVFCRSGLQVSVYNRSQPRLDALTDRVADALRFLARESAIDLERAFDALGRMKKTTSLEDAVRGADYIQECLPEDLEVKQDAFARVADLVPADVIIGSSCSGLRLADIVRKVRNHPERCIVAHPANPPHIIPFMEISGDGSSDEARETACRFMDLVGQKPIRCKEVYGYVLNRIQLALIQEALYLVEQGICSVEAVERAVTDGLGLRWAFTGPYGVEELNSANLEEGLRKYKKYMLEGFRELGKVSDYGDDFIKAAVTGFGPVMRGLGHDDYLRWRDTMVMRTRTTKQDSIAPKDAG
jgi:L-gulonate 3-dehydrogenase